MKKTIVILLMALCTAAAQAQAPAAPAAPAAATAPPPAAAPAAPAGPLVEGEKAFMGELKKAIPAERIVPIDNLYKKWQEVQEGKSKAIILDIRTHDEFDTGHILGASHIDSGHAYTLPTRWADPETEIWVLCRTKHRATYFTGMLYKYGYKNIYLVDGGIVGWIEKGYPLVNEYLGEIKVTKYDKRLKETFIVREEH